MLFLHFFQMADSSYYRSSDEEQNKFVLVEFEYGVQLVYQNWLISQTKFYWPNPAYKSNERYFKAVENG